VVYPTAPRGGVLKTIKDSKYMKYFLKFTFFKFILTFTIAILPLLSEVLYEWGVTSIYHLKSIIFFPYYQLIKPFAEFGEKLYQQNLRFYFQYSLLFLPFFLFYCYFLSCVVSFLINELPKLILNKRKNKK